MKNAHPLINRWRRLAKMYRRYARNLHVANPKLSDVCITKAEMLELSAEELERSRTQITFKAK